MMRVANTQSDSAIAESPLVNLCPVFSGIESNAGAAPLRTEQTSCGVGIFPILLVSGFLAAVGYVVLSACADGSPLTWLLGKLSIAVC